MYVNAIIRRRAYENFSPFDYSMLAYFSLNNVWLKVLLYYYLFCIPRYNYIKKKKKKKFPLYNYLKKKKKINILF